jgi:Sugar-transfer associated ATP-grasp
MITSERADGATELPEQSRKSYGRLGDALRQADLRLYQTAWASLQWARHERSSTVHLSLSRTLAAWRRGFFAESALIYDFPRNDPTDYLSDFQQVVRCSRINSWGRLYSRKFGFRAMLRARGFRQPETLAYVHEGRALIDPFSAEARYVSVAELEKQMLAHPGRAYALRPEGSWRSGRPVVLLADGGELRELVNGQDRRFDLPQYFAVDEGRASAGGSGSGGVLVERQPEQGQFWRELFPRSLNTIGLLTLWSPTEAQPFVARAVQRIGTAGTAPNADWPTGGISAPIDLETGRLGPGRVHPLNAGPTQDSEKPGIGVMSTGAVLPGWARVMDVVLRAAASMPFNRLIGWEVVVDSEGTPIILDASGNPEVRSLQVHGGLFSDDRIRRFYEAFGVVGPSRRRKQVSLAMEEGQEAVVR